MTAEQQDTQTTIAIVPAADMPTHIRDLGALLFGCVQAGASINFVLPFTAEEAEAFWRDKVQPVMQGGARVLWVARHGGRLSGSVQLDYDTPPNQPHRAEVTKLMVHPDFRRQGLARLLMAALEDHAAHLGRSLITLDTRTGDKAEPLYASMGYQTAGIIPGYCRDTILDRLDPTTIMYKEL